MQIISSNEEYMELLLSLGEFSLLHNNIQMREATRMLLKSIPSDRRIVTDMLKYCQDYATMEDGSQKLYRFFFEGSAFRALYCLEVCQSLLMPSIDFKGPENAEFQLNFIRAGGIHLLQAIFVNNILMRTSTDIMRSCFLSVVKMCKLIYISISFATISVVAKALKTKNPPSAQVHQSANVLQSALHQIVRNVEHSHKGVALHISKCLMQQATGPLPTLAMVESLQRIAWAAGVGGLACLTQPEQIHQLYCQQVTMRPPEIDDTNLVRESLEVLSYAFALSPSLLQQIQQKPLWSIFVTDILLRVQTRNIRAGAANQLFYMVAWCTQDPAPLTSQLSLLVKTIKIVAKEYPYSSGEFFRLLARLFNHAQARGIQLSDATKLLRNELQWLKRIRGNEDSSDDGYCDTDDSKTIKDMNELTVEFQQATATVLMTEIDKLMNQLQQLQNDKRMLEQQMNDGYKERENRITKLEGFINDQVAELDRMEGTLKQTVANKEILEKDYQKVNEQYSLAKDGYKARGDRIAELEKFINHQVAELDKIEGAMKTTVAKGIGDSSDDGHCDTDDAKTITDMNKLTGEFKQATEAALMVYCNKLTQEIKNQEMKATKTLQNQLLELQYERDTLNKELGVQRHAEENAKNKVDELTKELALVSENAKTEIDKLMNQLQQLQNDKRILEQQMNIEMIYMKDQLKQSETERKAQEQQLKELETERKALEQQMNNDKRMLEQQMNDGYKEREDRIAELEEFINDQVAELDKMEGTMKQTIANKKILEEDYQALQAQLEKALDPLENIEELKELVDLDEEIGRGAWGLVKKVSLHGTICAAKDIHAILINYASNRELERIKKSFLEECIKCSKLFHPNLVQFLGIHYPNKQAKLPWLVMELLDSSLTGFLKKHDKENVPLFVKASILYDISLGLRFLHGRDIIHRDLSSNNILLTKYLTAKITDLGVAKLVDPDGSKSHTVAPGTQHFLPPEVFSEAAKSHYGKSIDVFSLGCIMINVTAHKWPTPLPLTYYDPKLKKRVALSEVERRAAYLSEIQGLPELKVLIEKCLHDDSELRPNATTMVDDLGRLKLSYQKNSNFVGEEMNAVVYEKNLKLLEKRLSEQLLEREKLNKTLRDHLICHKCNRQFKDGQLQEYRRHIDKCCQ